MDITIVIRQLFILFTLVSIGVILRRTKVLDQSSNATLTQLLLKVVMPAAILTGIADSIGVRERSYLLYVLGMSVFAYLMLMLLAVGTAWLLRPKTSEDQGALASICMFPNIIYIGIPLTISLWGPEYLFYPALFNLIANLFAFSIGLKILAGSKAKISPKLIFNTLMNVSLFAIALFLIGIPLPAIVNAPLFHLRDMMTPMGMILLGSILGGMELKKVFSGWRVYAAVAVKLLVAPVVMFLILSQLIADPVMLGIFVLLSSSPAAIRTVLLAIQYGGNAEMVSQGAFLSTALSIVTIPLIILLLGL